MNTTYILLGLIVLVFIIVRSKAPKGVVSIDSEKLKMLREQPAIQLVDVRTPQEFKSHSIKGFTNIPLDQLNMHLNRLKVDKPIVVMCASGLRSLQATKVLSKNGFAEIYNLSGGINAYKG